MVDNLIRKLYRKSLTKISVKLHHYSRTIPNFITIGIRIRLSQRMRTDNQEDGERLKGYAHSSFSSIPVSAPDRYSNLYYKDRLS